jgi:capsular exopolysaccharide synthesis family protein
MYARRSEFGDHARPKESLPDYEVYSLPHDGEADQTLDTRKMALALWRGKLLLAACAAAGFLAGLAHVSQQEPVYRAVTSILYEPERLQIVDISEVLVEPDTGAGIGNQVEILNSTTLLGNIVNALGEDTILQDGKDNGGTPDTGGVWDAAAAWLLDAAPDPVSSQLARLGLRAQPEAGDTAPAQTEEEAQQSAARDAISYLRDNLEIEVISGSGVIELFYSSADPQKAALIANTISEEYIAFQKVSKNQDVLAAIDLVSNRIEELRQSVVESERNLENTRLDLARRRAQSAEMTGIQLAAHNQELAAIRLRLSESRARFKRAAAALAEGTDLWSVTEFRESELITDFRRREIEIRETIAQERAISGSVVTPSSVRSAALLGQAQQSIREEAAYIVAALEFEVASLEQREQQLEQMVRELEITSIERTADELFISRLEREVLANQTLLQTFVVRQKEISEQANLQSADARVLSKAEPPSHPDRQASNRILLASSAGALFICALLLLLRERMNNSVRDPRDLAEITPYPLLTSLPLTGRRKSLQKRAREFMNRPKCLLAESIRNLRTSLLYSDPDNQPQVVMLTSSVPGEGKSVTSFLTALASQHTEHDTILVSCDLRDASNARIYSKFPKLVPSKSSTGLVGYLRSDCSLEEALAVHPESGLHILAAGKKERFQESPADILSSPRFAQMIEALRERYKLVILDAPPVLVAADARLLARMSDSVVYLVHWNRTSKNAVREGLRELRSVKSPVAGCVLSLVSQSKARRYADNEFIYKQHYAGYYS